MVHRLCLIMPLLALLLSCDRPRTYAGQCSTPFPHWRTPAQGWHNLYLNKVVIDGRNRVLWNGEPVNTEQLRSYLSTVPTMNPVPATALTVDPEADCSVVDAIRREMDQRLQCRTSNRCGEGRGEWLTGPYLVPLDEMTPEGRRVFEELEAEADRAAGKAEGNKQ